MAIRRRPTGEVLGQDDATGPMRDAGSPTPRPTSPPASGSPGGGFVTGTVAPPDYGQSSESPRERQPSPGATPPQSSEPTIGAGSVSVVPPMSGPSPVTLASPARRGLFGSLGGLQGGGLGLPLDPTSNLESDPISGLIELLSKLGRG